MTPKELRITAILASVFALRMLGLCMLLPVFALEAMQYVGASQQSIGIAIGVYGLLQACLQVPFGMLSDRFGRKRLIVAGLAFILLGSLISAVTDSIYGLILGRALQGCGAIGSVVIAALADHTREQVRSSAMAILGASIGVAFVIAMVLGPWLDHQYGMPSIFVLTSIFAAICMGLILSLPNGVMVENIKVPSAVGDLQVVNLNFGALVLHASLAALFLVFPVLLQEHGIIGERVWQAYLGILLVAMLGSWQLLRYAERNFGVGKLLYLAICGLIFGPLLLCFINSWHSILVCMTIYFAAFCLLEASLPTLVTKYANANTRGAAMGTYATLQFLGVFFGGMIGGWLHGKFGVLAVISFSVGLAIVWLILSVIVKVKNEVKIWQEALTK